MSVEEIAEKFRKAIEKSELGEVAEEIDALEGSIMLSNLTTTELKELLKKIIEICYNSRMERDVKDAKDKAIPRFKIS